MNKPKASTQLASLAPTLGEEEARVYVQEQIAKGKYEDDLGGTPTISATQMTELIDALRKGLTFEPVKPAAPAQATRTLTSALAKGGAGEDGGVAALVDSLGNIETALTALAEKSGTEYTQLAKGLTSIGKVNEALLKVVVDLDARVIEQNKEIAAQRATIDSISKAAPKAVGAGALAQPTAADLAAMGQQLHTGELTDDEKLFNELNTFVNAELQKSGINENRRQELIWAQASLFSGAQPKHIAETINFTKG